MAQASLHRFFNTRKRPANDELSKISKKVLLLENDAATEFVPEKDTITKESAAGELNKPTIHQPPSNSPLLSITSSLRKGLQAHQTEA